MIQTDRHQLMMMKNFIFLLTYEEKTQLGKRSLKMTL